MNVEWNDSFKVGQADIDAQHRQLFDLIHAMQATDDPGQARLLIMQLYKHTREHFELEEGLMRQHRFPDLAAHTGYHNKLLSRLNTISEQVGQGAFDKPALMALMADWALRHTVQDDAPLAAFIRAAG
ncbi:bacteriohemerythrin [Rhodoferax sp.]|uniref:bacteriohemerythrin n=1 Tax=Rhodoferax sp. TaxID=50421 RepID=UPI0026213920|nr:bacteriohemerythrin [Rhodoferax sp.]MDD4944563.1 bacteriohemerythrin [Rhodoferax sp.]MDD5480413.1 bacteriohemerythrin [Rhodoferax sp.]